MSYSQYDEEAYIIGGFDGKCDGRFLDIGAWNPLDKSNTRALYELGWSGVMIEPSPGPLLNLLNEYANEPRITIVSAAMGLEPGYIEMMVTDDAVSTADRNQYDQWKSVTKFRGKLTVPFLTWPELTNRWGGFDFISIDAEGLSADLFLAMLTQGLQPTCVCVEHDNRLSEICARATPLHYNLVYSNGTNGVFVRK